MAVLTVLWGSRDDTQNNISAFTCRERYKHVINGYNSVNWNASDDVQVGRISPSFELLGRLSRTHVLRVLMSDKTSYQDIKT